MAKCVAKGEAKRTPRRTGDPLAPIRGAESKGESVRSKAPDGREGGEKGRAKGRVKGRAKEEETLRGPTQNRPKVETFGRFFGILNALFEKRLGITS